jgi:SPP1 family predicted phage head-tail adaptor
MGTLFLDAGLLRHRALIERNDPVPDAMGGAADRWREVGEAAVRVEPARAEVSPEAGQRIARITHRVTLRHRDGLERGMAFRLGARRLVIRTLHDPDETGRYLVCRCEEER